MQKLKRPVSIILSILMVVSMFVAVPVTASAATYVAKIGSTGYETLEDAFAHAVDGDTITVLADCSGNGIKAPQGKFNTTGLTVDFNNHTYTMDGAMVGSTGTETQAFQLLKDNKITFKNGTIYSGKAKMLVQNYSNLTLEGMTLTLNNPNYAYAYTLSNNNGNVVIEDTTINANPAGGFAFDVCRFNSYPSVHVTVKGDSVINGNVEVSASGNTAKDGFSLNLEGGEMYGTVVVDASAQTAMDATPEIATLTTDPDFKFYVAQIGDNKYETLEAAFAAAVDGNTITVLADSAGNGIKAPQGKFATGLTVDFGGHKYTVDANTVGSTGTETQAFQLLKGNTITFKNGTIYSEVAKMLVQNYSNLTLDNMTLTLNNPTYSSAYTLSNNNGNVVIDDTTINANPAGGFAFDVCRFNSYPSVHVTVTGDSVINGDVEISASKSDAKDGFSLTLESGELNGDIVLDQTAQNVIANNPDKVTITKDAAFEQAAPAGYKWDANGELVPVTYVAQIGDDKYETLEAAFAAAVDGDTITVLADCAGNGIKAPQGKFATGLTVDFAGHTYTVDGETVGSTGTETNGFQLLKGNTITFKNGTITSAKAKILVQNYSNLTLDGMTLTLDNPTYSSAYTLSNNNGNVVIDDTTINANPAGGFAFDVCRFSSYPSVNVTVTGNSVINGNVEVSASGSNAQDGFSLTLESGTMTGDIVLDQTAQNVLANAPEKLTITKEDTFEQDAPAGYEWKSNGDGTSSLSHVHDWDYDNVSWTFTENASHSIYAKYTLTCKTDPTHTKEQTGSGTLMSTVKVENGKFVYSHSAVKIDGNSVAIPNYTRNVADGIINQYELKAAVKVAGNYTLANDITGFYDNVKPVDGFVLDGQDHMIKYGTVNASGRVMFEAVDQNTKFTLKNITLDGNKRAKWAVCAYTGNSGKNAGNVITLDTVTIQNFKSNDYVGAINAFGSSTWNLKNCTITGNTTVDDSDGLSGSAVWAGSKATINIDGGTYDEVYLHSYSGTGAVLNADGGATINNLVLDLTKTDTLKANIDDATVGAITSNEGTIPEEAVVMDPAKATVAAPEGYKWVDSDETGMKTLVQIVYVAQIGDNKYETLEAAFAAAVDGDTITVLADCSGNGIIAQKGKFTTGLTVDFGGHTYTVDGTTVGSTGTETQAFQLLMNNTITFKNGTLTSDKAKMIIQNYSNLTLDNMVIDGTQMAGDGNYALSNNNGNVVIKDTTINAREDCIAFDVCRYNSYPSVHVTVTGNSVINGDVEIYASKGQAKDGFSLTLESGTMTGDIVVDKTAAAAMAAAPNKTEVTKKNTFDQDAPEGYEWFDNGNGTSSIKKLFVGHNLLLDGDIGVNFFLNPDVLDTYTGTKTVKFTVDGEVTTVDVPGTPETYGYKVTCNVVAARMAHKIKAEVFVNGTALKTTDSYSVQDYAEAVYKDNNKPKKLRDLAKAMLNYGAEAQTVFASALKTHPDRADKNVGGAADYSGVTAELVKSRINGTASNLNEVATQLDAKYYTNSLIYLQNNTLRIYFTPQTYPANMPHAGAYDDNLSNYYYYKDVEGIAAADLDDQQEFNIAGVKFTYSPLNYVADVLSSNMSLAQKNLAASLFLYNQAANAYFDD